MVLIGGMVLYGVSTGTPSGTATSTTQTTNTNTTVVLNPSAPSVITNTLVVASNSTAVFTGRVTPNGAQTSYWYEYGRTNTLGTRSGTQAVGSGYVGITTPAIISGLSANTVYYYRLTAQNSYGMISGQTLSFTTNTNPPVQGIGPTTRTNAASLVARTSATLNGQITPNSSETSYWFEYGETVEFGNTSTFQSAGIGTVTKGLPRNIGLSMAKPPTWAIPRRLCPWEMALPNYQQSHLLPVSTP